MRISVETESKTLPQILWSSYDKITADKENGYYKFTIQNLWSTDIFIENWDVASLETWYKIFSWNEVEIITKNINKINLVSDWAINDNVRIITN